MDSMMNILPEHKLLIPDVRQNGASPLTHIPSPTHIQSLTHIPSPTHIQSLTPIPGPRDTSPALTHVCLTGALSPHTHRDGRSVCRPIVPQASPHLTGHGAAVDDPP